MADNAKKNALTPSPKVAPDPNPLPIQANMGRASGVSTDTRVMTSAGPATVPLAVPTTSDPASIEMMKRWWADEMALDTAATAGLTLSREQKKRREKLANAEEATVKGDTCGESLAVYTSKDTSGRLVGGQRGNWICKMDERIKFREARYQTQLNEFKLYIEGADVTNYVEGAISWTMESTGGMNSCRFTLNNTQDAFIITPENICAGLDPSGWRVTEQGRDNPGRANWRVDETAKFIIYRNKYNAVDPTGKTPQIDQQTGMWLFPLNPYSCILNRHDCVRMFVRLPHVSGVRATDKKVYDLWMPVFTGFIKDYSWDDDPVMGPRYVKVTCYDYRGILERMRVAIAGAGIPSGNPTNKSGDNTGTPSKKTARPKAGESSKPGEENKGPSTYDFLLRAKRFSDYWKKWFETNKLSQYLSEANKKDSKDGDPYAWAQSAKLIDAFVELYKYALGAAIYRMTPPLNDQPQPPGALTVGTTLEGQQVNPSDPRMVSAIRAANKEMELMVCYVIQGIGVSLATEALIRRDTGVQNNIIMVGQAAGPGVPPRFGSSVLPADKNFKPRGDNKNTESIREVYRQTLIQAYVKWAIGGAIANPVDVAKLPPKIFTKSNADIVPSIQVVVTQLYDALIKGKDSQYRDQVAEIRATGSSIMDVFYKYKQQYDGYSKTADSKVQNIYVPLSDLNNRDWTSPTRIASFKGTTKDAKVQDAVRAYLTNLNNKSRATRTALAEESARSSPPSSDSSGTLFDYMVKKTFTPNEVPNWQLIKSRSDKNWPGAKYEPWPLNYTSIQFGLVKKKYEDAIRKQTPSAGGRLVTELKKLSEKVQELHNSGPSRALAGVNEVRTLGAIVKKFIEVDAAKVGIFGDLIQALEQGHPHPLAGKNFEQAIHFLCSKNSELDCGVIKDIDAYTASKLDGWNRVAVFGAIQRPLTFKEMQEIGQGTVRDFNSDYCPLKAFYHILLPSNGTGAQTVVKMHIAGVNVSSPEEPTFTTRLQLLNEVCEGLDYQFFVNGMGDLVFEVPLYNAYPDTFGPVFSGAYTISKDWINSSISEENQDVPTAWVVSGSNIDLRLDQAKPKGEAGKDHFDKLTIMNHTMVRRLGVKVETIPLKIPGVGQNISVSGGAQNAFQQLAVYAAFYIQRQLGRAHMLSVKYPFRPYVVPNRPLWLIPRQRIGLATSVTHTMTPPHGQCTTDSTIGYVRWMFRDGTYRFVGGGDRQPMDYVGWFSGAANYSPTEGIPAEGPLSLANITPRLGGAGDSPSEIANRIRAANAFSTNVSASFAELNEPPTVEQITQAEALASLTVGAALGAGITSKMQEAVAKNAGTPGSKAAVAQGPMAPTTADQKNKSSAGSSERLKKAQNPPATQPPPGYGDNSQYNKMPVPQFDPTGYSVDGIPQPTVVARNWQRLNDLHVWKATIAKQYNTWGLMRRLDKSHYNEYARGQRREHPGLDIMGIEGTRLLAPIPFDMISAGLQIYHKTTKDKKIPRSTENSHISKFNSTPKTHTYPIADPATGKTKNITVSGLVKNPFFTKPFDPKTEKQAESYAEYYDNYLGVVSMPYAFGFCPKAYLSSKGGRYLVLKENGICGLLFVGRGWYTPPADRAHLLGLQANARLRVQLSYVHLSRFAEDTVSDRGILGADFRDNIAAGTVVGYMGNTGNSLQPHLHINMEVMSPDSGTDEASFKAVAAANADFLTSQIVAMATGWEAGAGGTMPSPDLLNMKVDEAMIARAKRVFISGGAWSAKRALDVKRGNKNFTVADLVEIYKKDPAIAKFFRNKTRLGGIEYNEKKKRREYRYTTHLQTNPLFFFTPDQLVDMSGVRGAPAVLAGLGSGSASAPLGKSPAYNGTSLQWCSGLAGSTVGAKAKAEAKNQQAEATAGKNIAANPQNKAAEEEKLKQKIAKNNAPVKEEEAAKKVAQSNPESVRRRFDALSKRSKKPGSAPPIPGSGVSSDTGVKKT